MSSSYFCRGHEIVFVNDNWIYSDTKENVRDNRDRSCGNCGKPITIEGHDGCLGNLPSVINACCGHGEIKNAYICFANGKRIKGIEARRFIDNKIVEKK